LDDPALAREVNWIRFNYRVLEEAEDRVLLSGPHPKIRSSILRMLEIHLKDNEGSSNRTGQENQTCTRRGHRLSALLINNRGAWHINENTLP
jgi:hypothetical protein